MMVYDPFSTHQRPTYWTTWPRLIRSTKMRCSGSYFHWARHDQMTHFRMALAVTLKRDHAYALDALALCGADSPSKFE